MPEYNTGVMPRTDFRYEEFEGLLASFHLSMLPLKNSAKPEDKRDYDKAMNILNWFAQKYCVQFPEDAAKNPRAQNSWGNASEMPNFSTLDMMSSFWKDFGIGAEPETEDGQKRRELGRLILGVYDRYGIAKVGYEPIGEERVPVKLDEWNREKSNKSLAEVLAEADAK